MKIITEEMNYRKQMCEYATKHGVTKAAKRYNTYRKFVYRQLERYDGTARSLAFRSRRPHSHPNQHTESEYELLKHVRKHYQCDICLISLDRFKITKMEKLDKTQTLCIIIANFGKRGNYEKQRFNGN